VCVLAGCYKQTFPEGVETYLSADLAQHLQAESAHYSKGANYNEHDRVTLCESRERYKCIPSLFHKPFCDFNRNEKFVYHLFIIYVQWLIIHNKTKKYLGSK